MDREKIIETYRKVSRCGVPEAIRMTASAHGLSEEDAAEVLGFRKKGDKFYDTH